MNTPKSILLLVLIGFLFLVPTLLSQTDYSYFSNVISRIFIFSLFALSLNILVGHSGLVSMCHALFYGIGGYVVAIFAFEQFLFNQYIFILLSALVICSILAYVVGYLSLKTGGVYFIMTTLAFGQLGFFFLVSLDRYGGEDGVIISNAIRFMDYKITRESVYYLALVFLICGYYLAHKVTKSHFGVAVNAMHQNRSRMSSFGFNVSRYQLVMFIFAALLATVAGSLSAVLDGYISPWELHWTKSADVLIMIIIGGFKFLAGSILGASFFVLFQEFLSPITSAWKLYLGIFLLLLLFSPNGLMGIYKHFFKK